MTPEHFGLFYILRSQDMPFEERFSAAKEIGEEVLRRRIEPVDIPMFYPLTVDLWRSLGSSNTDRHDISLFSIRKNLANVCWRLSLKLPEGQKFFRYYPRVERAEGFKDPVKNKVLQGAFKTGYGTSLYDFHREYPIEGIGIRKNLISVITDDNEKILVMEWCKQNDFVVFCNRCGLDITYTNANDCPFTIGR
jgi:hypothetical protein